MQRGLFMLIIEHLQTQVEFNNPSPFTDSRYKLKLYPHSEMLILLQWQSTTPPPILWTIIENWGVGRELPFHGIYILISMHLVHNIFAVPTMPTKYWMHQPNNSKKTLFFVRWKTKYLQSPLTSLALIHILKQFWFVFFFVGNWILFLAVSKFRCPPAPFLLKPPTPPPPTV